MKLVKHHVIVHDYNLLPIWLLVHVFLKIIETVYDVKNSKANYKPMNLYDVCRAWLTAKLGNKYSNNSEFIVGNVHRL